MKKWMAIFLAAVMAFGLAATAMAEGMTLDQNTKTQWVDIGGVIPATFTWSIPNFEPTVGDEAITASGDLEFWDVCVPGYEGDIAITITSKNGNCFKDEMGAEIPYTLTAPNPVTGKDSYYLLCGKPANEIFTRKDGGAPRKTFNVALEALREGHYTAGTFSDELTFSAQCMNRATEKLTKVNGVWTYAG